MLVLSIISHNNSFDILNLVTNNLSSLDRRFIKIVVRVNVREQTKNYEIVEKLIKKADFKVVFNKSAFGFGKNHNLTFK